MKNTPDSLSLFPEDMLQEASPEEQQEKVLQGARDEFTFGGKRPTQCFTIKMPFPTYLAFKKEVQRLRSEAEQVSPENKEIYTMTNYVNAAVKHIILPGLKRASVPVTKTEAA